MMGRFYGICIMILCMISCAPNEEVISKEKCLEYMHELGIVDPVTNEAIDTPMRDSLTRVIFEHGKFRRGKFLLDVSRDYFIEQGLPSIAYDVVIFNVWEINTTLKDMDKDVRKDFEKIFISEQSLLF